MKPNKIDRNGLLHTTYNQARECVTTNPERARDLFDFIIYQIANRRYEDDIQVDEELEGVRVGVWLERAWYGLENNNLLL